MYHVIFLETDLIALLRVRVASAGSFLACHSITKGTCKEIAMRTYFLVAQKKAVCSQSGTDDVLSAFLVYDVVCEWKGSVRFFFLPCQ